MTEKSEARRAPRKTLRTLGLITSPRMAQPVDCTVLDLSASGAKISLGAAGNRKAFAATFDIPGEFCLQIPRDNISVDCRLAWQSDGLLGAQFLTAFRPLKPIRTKPKVLPEGGLRKPATAERKPEAAPRKFAISGLMRKGR